MDKKNKLNIRIAVENILYEHTTDDFKLEDFQEIRDLFNSVLDDFIKENNIT